MRISPILNRYFSHRRQVENNHTDYSRYRLPVSTDSYSFSGRVPKANYTSNARNAVLQLAEHGIGCFCCGKQTIPTSEINALESSGFYQSGSDNILKGLNKYKRFMKPLEKRVYNTLSKLHEQNPELSLKKLLEIEVSNINAKLIKKQSKVFNAIRKYAVKNLPEEKIKQLDEIFKDTFDEIHGRKSNKTFSRKAFIGLMYKFTRNVDPNQEKKILELAEGLPSSQNSYEAFIIKYSRKNNREIALRLIQKKQATIEHIKTKAEGGTDDIENFALECAECNWTRGSRPMFIQIRENPNMPRHAQKETEKIIRLIKQGKSPVTPDYLRGLKGSFSRESGGIIELDLNKL